MVQGIYRNFGDVYRDVFTSTAALTITSGLFGVIQLQPEKVKAVTDLFLTNIPKNWALVEISTKAWSQLHIDFSPLPWVALDRFSKGFDQDAKMIFFWSSWAIASVLFKYTWDQVLPYGINRKYPSRFVSGIVLSGLITYEATRKELFWGGTNYSYAVLYFVGSQVAQYVLDKILPSTPKEKED